jgi:cytochrome P450
VTHLVSHPDHIKYVLLDNDRNYVRGKFYENFKPVFGDGLLTADGQFWLRHRKMVQPLFHRRHVDASAELIVSSVDQLTERWERYGRTGEAFDVLPEMMRFTLSVLGKMTFGVDVSHVAETIAPAVRHNVSAMMPQGNLNDFLPPWLPTPHNRRTAAARKTLMGVMEWVREERRRAGSPGYDLTSLLLSARDDESGERLSEKEVEDEMMTIFLAGHETTGSGFAWALYALATHPEVLRKLDAELTMVLGDRPPLASDVPNLPYLSMVVDECLRVYPPIWAYTRDAKDADVIAGYRIPAGSSVFVSPYVTHRHPDCWKSPNAFDPDHFLPEAVANRPRFAYFPFGGGPRQCIGVHMAKLQMQIAVAMIVQRFHLRVVPGHPIERGAFVSLRPASGILMTVEPRRRSERFVPVALPVNARRGAVCPFAH